jgi:hypothetical protein
MGRIYMRVFVHNETDRTLVLRRSGLAHGDWTPGGWTPPDKILGGQTGQFQSEGSLAIEATTGTEGTVEYTVADGREDFVHIHFNSPLVESQYGNTFHVYAPPGYEVSDRGGQGERAELHVRLRPTADRMVPRFHPRGRALPFTNRWDAALPVVTVGRLYNDLWKSLPGHFASLDIGKLPDDWLPITTAKSGLCGGMVYTVMDYYYAHLQPPGVLAPTVGSAPTSRDDPLFQHIRERLLASFDILGGGWRFLAYSSPLYPNGDEGVGQFVGAFLGRSWISYREQWPRIQDDLDAGRLSPLGLIQTDGFDVGNNHQVLAYGYRKSGQVVRLYVYDPNEGRSVVTYDFDVTSTSGEVHVERRVDGVPNGNDRIWAFFRNDGFQPRTPPGGRPFDSMRPAILATSPQPGRASARAALGGTGASSLRPWLAGI